MDQNILHQSWSHHDSEDQRICIKNGIDFDQKYVELKAKIVEVYNKNYDLIFLRYYKKLINYLNV